MSRQSFAIIPTNGRECLEQCLGAIRPQVDDVILVVQDPTCVVNMPGTVVLDLMPELNISRWWNLGLDMALQMAYDTDEYGAQYNVAILNDDVIVPPGWFEAVSNGMRNADAAAACSGGGRAWKHTVPGPVDLSTRMQGFAFVLAGEKELRANEELPWFFSDDYIDWESRKLGGMVMIPDFHVEHLFPNGQLNHELVTANAVGAQHFVDLYGMRPW